MKATRVPLFLLACALVFLILVGTALATECPARTVDPIVSTAWLQQHLGMDGLVVVDVRPAGAASFIPGSISVPGFPGIPPDAPGGAVATKWAVGLPWNPTPDGLWMEMPGEGALVDLLTSIGVTAESIVVVVGAPDYSGNPPQYGWSGVTRVAFTLIYAGVKNVAVLDGGFPKWVAEGKSTGSAATPTPTVEPYSGQFMSDVIVDTSYVEDHIRGSIIVDARDLDVYLGKVDEPFWAPGAYGHIPTARPLPTPWVWTTDDSGVYRQTLVLRLMAAAVVGVNKDREIIVYCGVGGYASSWWYVLTQVLGYRNVKFYDGSSQAWFIAGNPYVDWTR